MKRLIAAIILMLGMVLGGLSPAHADPADIAAASRSVVRIVLVARDGGNVYYAGHGSGFAVTPTLIVTNAHLVEDVQNDDSLIIGIVPSAGSKSYGGKLIAVSRRNDLALIELQDSGRLPPMALLANPPADGSQVFAIGYPATVDRAQGFGLGDLIEPMAPVKTPGVISGGRTTRQFDTLLHTAALAAGNSGGPLVDACGRVLGVNSFGSISDGTDAEYGFAVSNREVSEFLRTSKVNFTAASSECRSAAELSQEEQERARAAMAEAAAQARQERERADEKRAGLLREAERDITNRRENHIAIAALLLALAVLAGGAGGVMLDRGKRNPGIATCSGAAFLLLAAVVTFLVRPSLADAEDMVAARLKEDEGPASKARPGYAGKNSCTILPDRSRVTVSDTSAVTVDWNDNGCVNGRTQYGREGARWARVFVPNQEETVSINSFDPQTGLFRTERFLLGIEGMAEARKIRGRYSYDQCSTDQDVLGELEDMQKALRQSLPAQPNEVLVYQCSPAPDAAAADQ